MKLHPKYLGTAVRSLSLRLTPGGRRRLALEHGAVHSTSRKPGLTDLTSSGVVSSDEIELHYYIAGPDCGEPADATVVFVHGFSLAAEVYYQQVDYLRSRFPRVRSLLFDVRGHGQTGPVDPDKCTIEGTADDVVAVVRECVPEGPIVLVGHSLGGLTMLNLIGRDVDDITSRIAGIVLVATSIESLSEQGLPQVLASPVAEKVRDAVELSPAETRKLREEAAGLLAPTLAAGIFHRPTSHELIELHAALIHETPLETFVGFFGDLQTHEEVSSADELAHLDGYILAGEKDNVTPLSQADRIHELWPRGRLQIAQDAGHMIPLEAPGILNNAITKLLQGSIGERPVESRT